jgi:hypothetical protein
MTLMSGEATPFDPGAPTVCDMNCFYEAGHDGPHQKWAGDDCDYPGCTGWARWRAGRTVLCDAHRKWRPEEEGRGD